MTIEEKRNKLKECCSNNLKSVNGCKTCPIRECNFVNCMFETYLPYQVEVGYQRAFGAKKEEVNHPDRYAGGKFECIDVMLDVFGADAVKHFCILNAFKYLWRSEKKNGVEDIKKAVWYLNKYIELGGEE